MAARFEGLVLVGSTYLCYLYRTLPELHGMCFSFAFGFPYFFLPIAGECVLFVWVGGEPVLGLILVLLFTFVLLILFWIVCHIYYKLIGGTTVVHFALFFVVFRFPLFQCVSVLL